MDQSSRGPILLSGCGGVKASLLPINCLQGNLCSCVAQLNPKVVMLPGFGFLCGCGSMSGHAWDMHLLHSLAEIVAAGLSALMNSAQSNEGLQALSSAFTDYTIPASLVD